MEADLPDLTTNDPRQQKQEESGGITVDNSAAEMYTTIFSISVSPLDPSVIWVGTDDGKLQVTRDGGAHWEDVARRVAGLPQHGWVRWVQASAHDPGTAYAAFDRHMAGDMQPYVYMTTDQGKHWTPLVTPADAKTVRGYVHVIKDDPQADNILYLGTEFGLWISIDHGTTWARYQGSHFPAVAVRDLVVSGDALVMGTHGRGVWIIDDLRPLRSLSPAVLQADTALLAQPVEQRLETWSGRVTGGASFVGPNPPDGAVISWYQRKRHLFGKLTMEIVDPRGTVVQTLPCSTHRGLNRVVWSMHLPPPVVPPAAQVAYSASQGPRVLPGTYTVRLDDNGTITEAPLQVDPDRRTSWTSAQRQARFDAVMEVYALFRGESELFARIANLRAQVAGAREEASPALARRLDDFDGKLDTLRKLIVATKEGGAITGEERLREHTDDLYGAILSWEGPPAQTQLDAITSLGRELAEVQAAFDAAVGQPLAALNHRLAAAHQPALAVPPVPALDEGDAGGAGSQPGDPDAGRNLNSDDLRDLEPYL